MLGHGPCRAVKIWMGPNSVVHVGWLRRVGVYTVLYLVESDWRSIDVSIGIAELDIFLPSLHLPMDKL